MIIKKASKFILAFFVVQILCLVAPQVISCQTATSKKSIAAADIAGDWGFGSSLMMTYLDHGTGNYSHSANIFGMKYVIKSDGTFVYKFAARYGSKTIREWETARFQSRASSSHLNSTRVRPKNISSSRLKLKRMALRCSP